MSKQITLVRVLNAFNGHDREAQVLPYRRQSMAAWLNAPLRAGDVIASLNGKVVEGEALHNTFPEPDDCIVMVNVPRGGGDGSSDGKQVLRIVAMIVLVVVANAYGAALGGAMGLTGGTAAAVGQAVIMTVGGLLISAALPPPKPPKNTKDDPSYGVDGAKNTSAEGMPVPVVYGKFRVAGNILNNYTVSDGDTQWLHMLMAISEGPIDPLDTLTVRINEQPLCAYKDVFVEHRQGLSTQEPIPWFSKTLVPKPVQHRLTPDYHLVTTDGEVDELRVDLVCPADLVDPDHNGKKQSTDVKLAIEYRPVGSTSWIPMRFSNSEMVDWDEEIVWGAYDVAGEVYEGGN